MDDMPMCRVCLKTSLKYISLETPYELSDASLLPVEKYDAAGGDTLPTLTYWDCFRSCTRLEVLEDEQNMPQSLCDACGLELTIAYSFLQKALNADKLLQELVLNKVSFEVAASEESRIVDSLNTEDDVNAMKAEYLLEGKVTETCEEAVVEEMQSSEEAFEEKYNVAGEHNENNATPETATDAIYMCKLCEECFSSQFELILHLRDLHEHFKLKDGNYNYEMLEDSDMKYSVSKNYETEQDRAYNNLTENEEYYELLEVGDVNENIESYASDTQCDERSDAEDADVQKEDDAQDNNHQEYAVEVQPAEESDALDDCLKCGICRRDFNTQRAFVQHWKTHQPTIHTSCEICQTPLSNAQSMREHLQCAHAQIVQCSKCDYWGKESKLPDHERRVHSTRHSFICNVCSKTFSSHSILKTHLKYHQRKEANIKSDACEICGKQFSTQHYLRQHMQVHRNERELYQCDYCDKIYVSKTALDNHIRLHKGETIACQECGKQFARQYELNVHMRFHTRDYPFECEVCGKKFAIKGHLRTHMWRHQGLKLQCEDCGKLFTSTKALQEHSFVHSEMPFRCCYCGRGYPSKQKFKVHLRTTHLIELTEEELQKVTKHQAPKPLQRKKLTLVQADSVMKEVEVKENGDNESVEEILVELC